MMSLKSGLYVISSRATGLFLGRHPVEDKTMLPKKVVTLPPNDVDDPIWKVEALHGGSYKLSIKGSPTVDVDGKLFGILVVGQPATEWIVTLREGLNIYTISLPDGKGWVAPSGQEEQVEVKRLTAGSSRQPTYPLNELFEFVGIDRDA